MILERFSEPFPPTGGMAAEGVRNLLGRPRLHPLELLVREALQNSWDAKLPDSDTVSVFIDLLRPTAERRRILRDQLLVDPPPALPLGGHFRADDFSILSFADRGTGGLGGPLRADEAGGEHRDFVDFVRNIGQPPDRKFGAGSFGYGKGAFYLASAARAIIVHTRCPSADGTTETRLIGCGLGDHYTDRAGVRHTGRHWWGVINDGVVDPALGDAADRLAEELGLRPFADGETGTTIAIVAPSLTLEETDTAEGVEDPRPAMEFIAEAIAWNFWPKMLALRGRAPSMTFALTIDGESVPVPDPDDHPRLALFAGPMRALVGDEPADTGLGGRAVEAWSQRPHRRVGRIALRRASLSVQPAAKVLPEGAAAMVDRVHHVALMRQSALVVRYEAGPPLATSRVGYGGVFQSDRELDEIFRRAEPPTHDDWVPTVLEKSDRRLVNVALRRVREITGEFAAPVGSRRPDAEALPIGQFSAELAALIPRVPGPGSATPAGGATAAITGGLLTAGATRTVANGGGTGAGTGQPATGATGGAGPGEARPGPRLGVVRPAAPRQVDDEIVVELGFRVRGDAEPGTRLRAVPSIMTLDGAAVEREAPIGAAEPVVLRWIDPGGIEHQGSECELDRSGEGDWALHVTHLPDAIVRIELETVTP